MSRLTRSACTTARVTLPTSPPPGSPRAVHLRRPWSMDGTIAPSQLAFRHAVRSLVHVTDPAGIPALIDAIRPLHGTEARHLVTVPVQEKTPDGRETVWEGDVEVFMLLGHPKATKAYAWSEATTGDKRGFFVVLHAVGVDSPVAALRASILADARGA